MLEITNAEGQGVKVNIDHIVTIVAIPTGSAIATTTGLNLSTNATPEEVEQLIRQARLERFVAPEARKINTSENTIEQ